MDNDTNTENNWKITNKDGSVLLKVVNFPCFLSDDDTMLTGESMWVEQVSGDDNQGTGRLRNQPVLSELEYDDLILYAGGTDETKPSYQGKVE